MSSSSNTSTIEENLANVRDRLQREDLKQELDDAADKVERILLLLKLEGELYDADNVTLSGGLVNELRTVRERVDAGDVDDLETAIDSLHDKLSSEQREVDKRVASKIDDDLDKIAAMRRLNDRVEKVQETRIEALRDQVSDCQNLEFISGESLSVKFQEIEREAEAIETEFEDLQQQIFDQFYGTPLEESIRRLLDDEALRLDSLSPAEIERLQESNLADCLELVLS
jgi:hypothetical protein